MRKKWFVLSLSTVMFHLTAMGAQAQIATCGSCAECTTAINDDSNDEVQVAAYLEQPDEQEHCIKIERDNVTLNCLGHTIEGLASEEKNPSGIYYSGVYAENRTGITIKNCVIKNFKAPSKPFEDDPDPVKKNLRYVNGGIHLKNVSHSLIVDNVVKFNRQGIYLQHSSANRIEHNIVTRSDWAGIPVLFQSHKNLIYRNVANENRHVGIAPCFDARGNSVIENTIIGYTPSASNGYLTSDVGICLCENSQDNKVVGNRICNNEVNDLNVGLVDNGKGYNNTCDKSSGSWSDWQHSGCTNSCN